jgi:ornithine cyclodeaminase
VELADVLLDTLPVRKHADDIVIYKSVGVGLEDVALAGIAYQRVTAAQAAAA